MNVIQLGNNRVGIGQPCFLIAEIGGNFSTFDQACRLIDEAAEAGVHAVKIQTFRASTLTTRGAVFEMENTGNIPQYQHFEKFEVDENLHRQVFDYARSKGLFVLSTPSHPTDVDMLENLGVAAHKIGSDDALNIPLLRHVARTNKPVLLSTGMCTMEEARFAVDTIRSEGNEQIILFHCTTNYPTHPQSVNLRAMLGMQQEFDFPVGYSDHTIGIDTCYAAAVLGAPILEFHFTYDKAADGPDHMLSKDLAETSELVRKVMDLPILLGDGVKRPAETELTSLRNNRKSLVLIADVKKGEKFTALNIDVKRPGYGVPGIHYDEVIGKTASRDLLADGVLAWEDLADHFIHRDND